LSCKEQIIPALRLPCLAEHLGTVDIGVTVHHAEANELGVLESWNHAQDARLFGPFQLGLKADQAVVIPRQRILPQLNGRVRVASRSWVREAHRLHRAKAKRVVPAMCHHFDWQAALEELLLVEVVNGRRFCRRHRLIKRLVLVARHRTVQIIALWWRFVTYRTFVPLSTFAPHRTLCTLCTLRTL
jgi:hypothetical protein